MRRRRIAGGERFDATGGEREAWTPDDHEENAAFRNESRVKRIGCGGGELTLGRWPEKTAAAAAKGGGGELGRPNGESKEAGVLLFGLAHVAVINSKAQRSFHIRAGPYKKACCGSLFHSSHSHILTALFHHSKKNITLSYLHV